MSTAYQKLLSADAGATLPVETVADEIAAGVISKARKGDVRAAVEIADRTEWKATPVVADADNGPVKIEVVWVNKGLAGEGEEEDQGA